MTTKTQNKTLPRITIREALALINADQSETTVAKEVYKAVLKNVNRESIRSILNYAPAGSQGAYQPNVATIKGRIRRLMGQTFPVSMFRNLDRISAGGDVKAAKRVWVGYNRL